MYQTSCRSVARLIGAALLVTATTVPLSATAKSGIDVYDSTCLLCHGLATAPNSWLQYLPKDGSSVEVAVVTPRGPSLSNIVGRPAGTIVNFKYSKGMRKFAETGAVWDRETLDKFLTDSRAYVKGTFMILKLGPEDRKLVLDYLEGVAKYRP